MPSADFASVFAIIVELVGFEMSVFVTNQTISRDVRGVEFDLDLHVFGNGDERAVDLIT